MNDLLTREEFKKQVFAKTNGKCCVPGCTCDAVDAHHIMDRRLWLDGGYYLSNGASLCAKHHLDAEKGIITPLQCFEYMKINLCELLLRHQLHDRAIQPHLRQYRQFRGDDTISQLREVQICRRAR